MKSLMETLNETLENSLQLEIAKLADSKSEERQEMLVNEIYNQENT
ncbi:MAG: hypothetical protein KH071_04685 [Paraprevotella sp.]|jgi:hypothetical protein|nr:hypothetical protein [Paraprevotella sp.]MBS4807195.1 hypothetical protein [Paraprevotella sp.]